MTLPRNDDREDESKFVLCAEADRIFVQAQAGKQFVYKRGNGRIYFREYLIPFHLMSYQSGADLSFCVFSHLHGGVRNRIRRNYVPVGELR